MPLPLSGLLGVSLEQAVAAPMCTCRLADAGARVIKVERPEGDFARYYDKLAVPRAAMAAKQAATEAIVTRSERAAPASPPSAGSGEFPSPLWGGVRGGGGAILSQVAPSSSHRITPPPQPSPTRGEGAHRVRGEGGTPRARRGGPSWRERVFRLAQPR